MMAEFLVCKVVRSARSDPQVEAQRYKQGDVVSIQEDGYPWSAEATSDYARVVKAPGIPKAAFVQLLASTPATPDEYRRIRAWKFKDIVNIPETVNLPNAQAFLATHCEQHPALPVSAVFDLNLRAVR